MDNVKTFNLIAKQAVFFVAVIGLFIPMAFSAEQPNLVKNNSFENDTVGNLPADYVQYLGTVGAVLAVDNGGYNGSLKSAKISGAANEAAYLYTINVLPGEKYKVESFCKQIGDGTVSMQIFWKKAVIDVTVPDATVTTTLTLRLHVEKQTSGTVWFDNVSVQKN